TPLRLPEPRRPIDALKLQAFHRVYLREATATLLPALGHPDAAAVSDVDDVDRVVEAFARSGQLGRVPDTQTPGEPLWINQHGDLHGGNVLVSLDEQPQPVIVDLASFGPQHWSADVARLMVDIVLRCIDGTVEGYFWRNFQQWRRLLRTAAGFDP